MKFEIAVEKLHSAIDAANRITLRNGTLQALTNILLVITKGILKVRATNLSLGVEFTLPIKSEGEGVVSVDGKTLSTFLNTIQKNKKVSFELQDQTLKISSGSSKTLLKTYPYDDFPTLPSLQGEEILLPKKEFISGIRSTVFAAAVSDIKPEIASVYITKDGNTLTFAATDSFRLAEKKESVSKLPDFDGILIPQKNIIEIAKILEDISGNISCIIGENQITLSVDGIYITSRIVNGSFPNYTEIIPKTFETEVITLKQDLITLLKSAQIFSDKFNQVTFTVNPQEKKCECIAKNTNIGEFTGELEGKIQGDPVSISFNQKYLLECLQSIPQDSITLGFNGPQKAIVVRGASFTAFTYLLMPMNR